MAGIEWIMTRYNSSHSQSLQATMDVHSQSRAVDIYLYDSSSGQEVDEEHTGI